MKPSVLHRGNNYWKSWLDKPEHLLLLSVFFSVSLVLIRFGFTRNPGFLFLCWNLFLAWIPYGISRWLERHPAWIENNGLFGITVFLWLLFLPNSFYILTDLFHLKGITGILKWFDLTLIVSFAWNGLLPGILSLRSMERIVAIHLGRKTTIFFTLPVMLLNALGIYLGRYLRYNSWDVFTSPLNLFRDIAYLVIHPLHNKPEWAMIGCFAFFMMLMYETLKKFSYRIR